MHLSVWPCVARSTRNDVPRLWWSNPNYAPTYSGNSMSFHHHKILPNHRPITIFIYLYIYADDIHLNFSLCASIVEWENQVSCREHFNLSVVSHTALYKISPWMTFVCIGARKQNVRHPIHNSIYASNTNATVLSDEAKWICRLMHVSSCVCWMKHVHLWKNSWRE